MFDGRFYGLMLVGGGIMTIAVERRFGGVGESARSIVSGHAKQRPNKPEINGGLLDTCLLERIGESYIFWMLK